MASFSFPLNIPTNKNFSAFTLHQRDVVGVSRSVFTGTQQTQGHQGQWWEFEASLPVMLRADADVWRAFFSKLDGMKGTFLMGDPKGATARGTAGALGDSIQVNGAQSAQSDTLAIKNATINETGYLLEGDYLSIGTDASTRLHIVRVDANTDGSGEATLDIWPRLREAVADNDTVTIASAKGVWRLSANQRSVSIRPPGLYELTIAGIEALNV